MSGETKWTSFVGETAIGLTASTLSAISSMTGVGSLEYSQIGLKSLLKVGITTGVSSTIVFMLHDKVIEMIQKKIINPF